MWWRYHIFILLVGVPTCRIFSSSTYQTNGRRQDAVSGLADEELVERLIKELQQDNGAGVPVKKDHVKFKAFANDDNNGNNNNNDNIVTGGREVNLAEQEGPATQKAPTKDGAATQQHPTAHAPPGKASALSHHPKHEEEEESSRLLSSDDTKFAIFVGAGLAAGFIGIMVAGVCYYKFRRGAKAASDISYPAYGVTGPMKEKIPSPGDRKLAQSAQMYHYQHQKQQMIAMEKANGDMKHDASEDESEEDNVEGDYTVYECPGLAPTGEMEVKNPLFRGEEVPPPPTHHEYADPHANDPEHQGPGQAEGQGRESPTSPSSSQGRGSQ